MYNTQIQKWGNSQGIRIPKSILESLGMSENDRVEIIPDKDSILIKKSTAERHLSIEERLTAFYGRAIEEIDADLTTEYDWGKPMGEEIW